MPLRHLTRIEASCRPLEFARRFSIGRFRPSHHTAAKAKP